MSIEEKNDAIQEYCADCNTCKIKHICDKVHGIFNEKHPKEVDEAYSIISNLNADMVNHPNHYTNGGMECFDEMLLVFGKETVANFCLCNAWKYRYRAVYKNGEEDIKKSHWYMNKYKELTSNEWE